MAEHRGFRSQIPTAELERRWAATRAAMARAGLDCLIAQNSNMFLGGYVRWLADTPAYNGYTVTVIFPADEGMTIISHGAKQAPGDPPLYSAASAGIQRRMTANYFRSVHYTDTYDAEQAIEALKPRRYKQIGLVGRGSISAAFADYLRANLPGVEFVDSSDLVDRVMVPKSEWELARIRETAALQDRALAHIVEWTAPGKTEHQMYAELWRIGYEWGTEAGLILIGSAPMGQANPLLSPTYYANRTFQAGDAIALLFEVNGPGGLYTELARPLTIGTPTDELLAASQDAVTAQQLTVAKLVPGAQCPDIVKAHNVWMVAHGWPAENRLYAHGQGYNLVERPLIREDEPMPIQEHMNITVHPFVANDRVFINFTDNYIVTATGAVHIHKTPSEIMVAR